MMFYGIEIQEEKPRVQKGIYNMLCVNYLENQIFVHVTLYQMKYFSKVVPDRFYSQFTADVC